jgi:hypothetical protein
MMIIFDLEVVVVCWISGELSSRVVPAGLINFLGLGGGSVMESIREALFYFLISIISLHQHSDSTVYYYLLYYYNDGGARFISISKNKK